MRKLRTRRASVKGVHLNGMKLCSNTDLLMNLNIPKTEKFVKT